MRGATPNWRRQRQAGHKSAERAQAAADTHTFPMSKPSEASRAVSPTLSASMACINSCSVTLAPRLTSTSATPKLLPYLQRTASACMTCRGWLWWQGAI